MCFKIVNNFFKNILKKLDWWDIGFIKMSVLFFTIILVKMFPEFLNIRYSILIFLMILFALPVWIKILFKK